MKTAVLGQTLIGEPCTGCTQTYITVGGFDTRQQAENCNKYIQTKFARALLSILKCTQHNAPHVWAKVPVQDFTPDSDIDWSRPIWEVDAQLYRKYGLSDKEIKFIESHIKYRKEALRL